MERQLRIWDVSNGNLVGYRAEHDEGILGISFSPDERRMATSSKDRSIRIWEMETGESLSEAMLGHGGSNVSLAEFCAGDSCLVAFSRMSGGLSYWPAARVPVPVPEWILEIAAILSGPENGVREPVERSGLARLLRIKAVVNASSSTDYYTRWARWFFANRDTRPPFPE